ncbi:TPA: hypothetical protein EYP44_02340, partial [Candidatus Bathyarchaeota archaeon]|nr:hypothetical protein [Candidatus Bathyarchaeota archaeon]
MLEKLYGELMNLRVIRKKAELFRGKRFPVDGFVRIGGEPYWIQDGEAHYLYILEEVSERCFLHQPGTLKDCALAAMALVDMDKVDKIVAIETMALPICSVLAVMAGKPMAIVGKRRY